MELRLYKQPYVEPYHPAVTRLLFEGRVPADGGAAANKDFYVYAWIRENGHLDSFQAVLADAVTVIFRSPGYLVTGLIGHFPMSRTITKDADPYHRELIYGVMQELRNEHFPHLLSGISAIARGGVEHEVSLSSEEQDYLSDIREKRHDEYDNG